MSFLNRHVWLATTILAAAACMLFALLFYPRGIDFDAQLARAEQRYSAYSLVDEGLRAHIHHKLPLARKKYEAAIEIDPTLYRAYAVLGQLEVDEGHLEHALKDFDESVSLSENQADVYNSRAVVKWRLGDRRAAMHDLDRALEYNKGFDRARTNRGLARLLEGDTKGAKADFEASLEDREKLIRVQRAVIGLAIVHAIEGRYEQALDGFSLVAGAERANGAISLYNRAKVYEAMGNTEAARQDREAYQALKLKLESTDSGTAASDDEA